MIIRPAKNLNGTLTLPGDKSVSHRAAIFAALADGTTVIENFSPGADCASTLSCLEQLGVHINREGNTIKITGAGKNGLQKPEAELDCGNSGSTMRMLAGVLAGQDFASVMTGDESLSTRPMGRVIEPLTQMGAQIESTGGHAPLKIAGKNPFNGISYPLPKPSAQVKSCVLLAGLFAGGKTTVVETVPTRDHTERMLRHFGVAVEIDGDNISVGGGAKLTARDVTVPADISSAAFFMVAAACVPESNVALKNLGLNPSRSEIITTLQRLGAAIKIENITGADFEPAGDVVIMGGLANNDSAKNGSGRNIISGKQTAALIDEIPVLAVFGTQLENGLEIRDARELRIKESDRIKSVVANLKLMGADVAEFEDGLRVGRSRLKGARVDSYGDHRIAMAFAVAALFAESETEIIGPECCGISFPGFFPLLEQLQK